MKRNRGVSGLTTKGYLVNFTGGNRKNDHVLVAEKALGRELRGTEEVHHVNEVKSDNRPENLVICPNRAYHMFLHRRADAYDSCGHVDWLKCPYCKQYDDPMNMAIRPRGRNRPGQFQWRHSKCASAHANGRQ